MCVFYNKEKRQNAGQSGQRNNTDKVQEEQKVPPGAWIFVLCVASKDKRHNAGQSGQTNKCR